MAAQSLKVLKGSGCFLISGSLLTNDSSLGSPYPSAAGNRDFTSHPAEQDMLASTNHPTTPQTSASVAFIYSEWT